MRLTVGLFQSLNILWNVFTWARQGNLTVSELVEIAIRHVHLRDSVHMSFAAIRCVERVLSTVDIDSYNLIVSSRASLL
jgi:hypothetical protein